MSFNPIIFNIDQQGQKLVAYGGSVSSWPQLFQGDVRDIQIGVLQPSGNQTNPYTVPNLNGYTMYVTMTAIPNGAGNQKIYVGPVALTWNASAVVNGAVTGAFTGTLNFTGSNLATDMAAVSSLVVTVEINISLGGTPQGLYQNTITIYAPANANGVVVPQPPTNYMTATQTLQACVPQNGGSNGQGFIMLAPNGNKYFVSVDNDGTLSAQPAL